METYKCLQNVLHIGKVLHYMWRFVIVLFQFVKNVPEYHKPLQRKM